MRRAGAALTILVAVACGGDGDDRLSKAEFIERADRICAEANTDIKALDRPGLDPGAIKRYAAQVVDIVEQQVADLKQLRPPAEDEDEIDRLYAEVDAGLAEARKLEQAGDLAAALRARTNFQARIAVVRGRAQRYGFADCGQGFGAD